MEHLPTLLEYLARLTAYVPSRAELVLARRKDIDSRQAAKAQSLTRISHHKLEAETACSWKASTVREPRMGTMNPGAATFLSPQFGRACGDRNVAAPKGGSWKGGRVEEAQCLAPFQLFNPSLFNF